MRTVNWIVLILAASVWGVSGFAQEGEPPAKPEATAPATPEATPPATPPLGDFVYVRMTTTLGDMVLELNHAKAPITVQNFVQYADSGFYDGTMFHRIIKGFMVQGGGMTPDYVEKEHRAPIKNEADNGLKNVSGTIAMARTGEPDSATCQFFINVVDNPKLDFGATKSRGGWGYCVFGKVIDGLDTLEKIRTTPTHTDSRADQREAAAADTPVVINKVVRVDALELKDVIEKSKKAEEEAAKQAAQAAANAFEAAQAFVTKQGGDVSKGQKTESGLWYVDEVVGEGQAPPVPEIKVTVHYTGWLPDGTKFDSSVDRGQPMTKGLNELIKGWMEGVGSMKVGGKRFLIVPPNLGYGKAGFQKLIPPDATLIFHVELISIEG